ncbi:hypothetical protein F4818DRAFT_456943 [Hypoxylon cercidicola]|nr:hypothetical protein F4818DRAFT_456943 [Hypoxylon cercidicola]
MRQGIPDDEHPFRYRDYPAAEPPSWPSITWLIFKNKDFESIRQCIAAYWRNFPRSLEGDRGRLDVIQELYETGVPINYDWEEALGPWPKFEKRYSDPRDLLRALWCLRLSGREDFHRACIEGHDDLAYYMIEKGLEVKIDHIFRAAHQGCFRSLDALLQHPTFKDSDKYHLIVAAVLEYFKEQPIVKGHYHVYKTLMRAAAHPSFDEVLCLKTIITGRIMFSYRKEELDEAIYCLDLLMKLNRPISSSILIEFAKDSVRDDLTLTMTRVLLEKYIFKLEEPRQRVIRELLAISLRCSTSCTTLSPSDLLWAIQQRYIDMGDYD